MDFPGSFMDPTFYDLPLHHSDVNQQLHDAAARHHFHDVTNLDGAEAGAEVLVALHAAV
jgi:hypothetical protein